MSLTLEVLSYQGETPQRPLTQKVDAGSISIGRRESNTFILADPYVSGHHATVTFQFPDYFLEVHGVNGIYINPDERFVEQGQTVPLHNQDRLSIGEYEVLVAIEQTHETQSSDDMPSSVAQHDFFSTPEDFSTPAAIQDSNVSDFAEDPLKDISIDNVIGDSLSPPDNWPDDDVDNAPFKNRSDLLANNKPEIQRVEAQQVSPINEAYTPPAQSGKPSQNTPSFPDDFPSHSDLTDTQSTTGNTASVPLRANIDFPENWLEEDETNTPTTTAKTESTQDEGNTTALNPSSRPAQSSPLPPTKGFTSEKPQATSQQTQPPPAQDPPQTDANNTQLLNQFLAGAGLNPQHALAQQCNEQTFFMIGQLFRTAVEGSMQVLMARAKIKSEMRIDVTTLRAASNNPMKFSFSPEEAINRLLAPPEKGYMPPEEAMQEAFEDIIAHQVSVLAGMQTALKNILKRFDPETLEKRLQKTSPISANIPIHKEAKLWSQFEVLYEEIEKEAADDFNRLFGYAFAKAYEEQVQKLKSSTH